MSDIIFAKASGAGKAGVSVFRLSGTGVFEICTKMINRDAPLRQAVLRTVKNPYTDEIIDQGVVIAFKGPASFTGEDCVEFHLHGGAAIETALYDALNASGARPAQAGEFTRRALANGKLDLAQVEGLADLIDAETSLQHKQALGQYGGRLSQKAEGWREGLLAIMAPLEADVDFPDEGDVPAAIAARAGPAIDELIASLKEAQGEAKAARSIRDGVRLAILGAPNAGKSTLLNRLAGHEAAIVSPTAGTTRDVIEVRLDLGGAAVMLADTAGLRHQTSDDIEREGMRRALDRGRDADLRIFMVDASQGEQAGADAGAISSGNVSRETFEVLKEGDFLVLNKQDQAQAKVGQGPLGADQNLAALAQELCLQSFAISAKNGEGVSAFLTALTKAVEAKTHLAMAGPLTRARHVAAVNRAIEALSRARESLAIAPELAAEDARLAARALGEITGAVDVEDVLGEIFSSFCIGK